jgi:RimJ/RimL family protein N-acetyltransferase
LLLENPTMTDRTDPILLDFPDQFETERLIIRAPRPGDGPAYNAAVRESIDELRPWMPWAQAIPTVEQSEAFMRRKAVQWLAREDLMLTLWRKSDGVLVGGSGLHRIDWDARCFEIGYWIRTSLSGQGYMTEAVRGITRFAFAHLDAQRIEIRCDALNTRSAAVAKRAGYALEARLQRQARGVDGELRDTLIFVRFTDSP